MGREADCARSSKFFIHCRTESAMLSPRRKGERGGVRRGKRVGVGVREEEDATHQAKDLATPRSTSTTDPTARQTGGSIPRLLSDPVRPPGEG